MNSEVAGIVKHKKGEIETLGKDALAKQVLKNLRLKTVVKESHCTPIAILNFNRHLNVFNNLFATVGKNQVSIYDDEHMGDYIGLVVHFTNDQTEHAQGGELSSCCWVSAKGWSEHAHGDACLAVAGADTNISIISIVKAQVIRLLKGHTKELLDLASCPGAPGLIASLSKDGTARLWDAPSETCILSQATDGCCLALSPDGDVLAMGGRKGSLQLYHVPEAARRRAADGSACSQASAAGSITGLQKPSVMLQGAPLTEAIDCLEFLDASRLCAKSVDGRMAVWDMLEGNQLVAWRVPACNGLAGRSRFGATPCGSYVAVGSSCGDVNVYETWSGSRLAHVAPEKVRGPVKACGISADCRHLLAVLGSGFIFRYEYRSSEAEKENAADSANQPGDMDWQPLEQHED